MNKQNNIDDLFKNSAQQFSAPAPKRAWANIDGVLKRKRRIILFQRVLLAATVVIIASVAFFVNINTNTNPQFVDSSDSSIETPILNNNNANSKSTNIVSNENIIENKNIDKTSIIKINNNEPIETTETEIVNVVTTLEETLKSNINDVEDNNIIVNNASKLKAKELDIDKEIVENAVIAKGTEVDINKSTSFNKHISEVEINELKTPINNEVSMEVAQIEGISVIKEEPVVKEKNEELKSEIIETETDVKESPSEGINNSTIKPDVVEVVNSEQLTQSTETIESKVIESAISPIVEESESVVTITEPEEVIIPSVEEAQIARARARAAASNVPKKLDVDFLVSQTYGISVTNGIGKTPEIENPTLSEAGASKANTWFSAAVNIELDVNNWVIKSGVRRYNLMIHGDFEVKQKNPWNVDLDKYAFSELGYIKIFNINTNLRLAKPSSIIYIQDFNHYNINVRYIDIPLSVGYKFTRKKLSLVPHLGVNYTMAYSNEVELTSEDGYYMFGEVTDLKELIIGVTAGCSAYYDFSDHFMVGLDAEMVYYPSSVSNNETFSYKPYSLLVGPSIAFKF